jgi:trigger factor
LVATFRFEVMPEIKVEKYKDLEIPFEPTEFKAEMVDGTIKEFQEQMATTKEVEGEIAAGDIVTAKIGFIDEDGKISKEIEREFVVNDNPYCKSFNNKVIGSKVGDEFDNMLFTKSANSKDSEIGEKFYGKDFHITILSANQKELPEINDEFAKDMEYDSLSHLRETVESELKKKLENEDKEKLRSAIIGELIKQNPFELPHSIVHKYAEDMAKPYAEAYKMEIDQLLPMYEQLADFNMKSHYLINEIKQLEDIKFTEDDREKLIAAEAAKAGEELEKYKELNKSKLESQDFLYIAEEEKVLDLIKESSKFVEVPQEKTEEEK